MKNVEVAEPEYVTQILKVKAVASGRDFDRAI
jgi:hypothetical protein